MAHRLLSTCDYADKTVGISSVLGDKSRRCSSLIHHRQPPNTHRGRHVNSRPFSPENKRKRVNGDTVSRLRTDDGVAIYAPTASSSEAWSRFAASPSHSKRPSGPSARPKSGRNCSDKLKMWRRPTKATTCGGSYFGMSSRRPRPNIAQCREPRPGN